MKIYKVEYHVEPKEKTGGYNNIPISFWIYTVANNWDEATEQTKTYLIDYEMKIVIHSIIELGDIVNPVKIGN